MISSPAPKKKHSVELSSKELDHICNVLAVDAETIEDMFARNALNKTDESLIAEHKLDLALIAKLANSKQGEA